MPLYKSSASIILIISVSALLYSNSINNGFTLDDTPYLVNSDYIKDWKNLFTIFTPAYLTASPTEVDLNRPIMTWSLIIEYSLWGLNSKGYHITNILLHTLNSLLLYLLVLMLLKDRKAALLSAIFFTVHPLHSEAVNGINYREDLLVTCFYLVAVIFFLKIPACKEGRKVYIPATLFSFVLALLSKEMAVTLPIILFLLHVVKTKDLKQAIYDGFWLYLFCLLILFIYISALLFIYSRTYFSSSSFAFLTLLSNPNLSGEWRLFVSALGQMLVYFLKFLLFPVNSSYAYDIKASSSLFEPLSLISLLGGGWIIINAVRTLKTNPKMSFPALWFFVALIPVATTIYRQPLAERFLYLPSIGPAIMLAVGLCWLFERNKRHKTLHIYVIIITIITLTSYATITLNRNRAWASDLSLFRAALKVNPMDQRTHLNLARYYSKAGNYTAALEEYRTALSTKPSTGTLTPFFLDEPLTEMGKIYFDIGDYTNAITSLQAALIYFPQNIDARFNLALAYNSMGLREGALTEFKRVADMKPDFISKLVKEYQTTIQLHPDSVDAKIADKRIMEVEKITRSLQ